MSLVDRNYSGLKATIAEWLNRADLTAQIPDFIILAESTIRRRLKRTVQRGLVTNTATPNGATALDYFPLNFDVSGFTDTLLDPVIELLSMRLINTGSAHQEVPIRIGTFEQLSSVLAEYGGTHGRPTQAAVAPSSAQAQAGVLNSRVYVAPLPDQVYTAEVFFYKAPKPLSDSVTQNEVLTEAPDVYLFGALMNAAPFLEHDERIPVWQSRFDAGIAELNLLRERAQFGASFRPAYLPVVFG